MKSQPPRVISWFGMQFPKHSKTSGELPRSFPPKSKRRQPVRPRVGPSPAVEPARMEPHSSSPPFKGAIGAWIQENISNETWNDWIGQGTKVINELRLDFSRDEDQETYERQMYEFLGIDDDLLASLGVETSKA